MMNQYSRSLSGAKITVAIIEGVAMLIGQKEEALKKDKNLLNHFKKHLDMRA